MTEFVYIAFLAILGALLRDIFLGCEIEQKSSMGTLLIGLAVALIVTPILLWAGWSPP